MKYFAMLALLFATAGSALGQDEVWKDKDGKPVPQTESMRSRNGLLGWLLVTPDANWQEKWETPPETAPHFSVTDTVERGGRVFVLIFFGNLSPAADGSANLTCDIDITRPDGTASMHQADAVCFRGMVKGKVNPGSIFLADQVIGFLGEPSDPAGKWQVRVTLKDNVRKTVLPLSTFFILK